MPLRARLVTMARTRKMTGGAVLNMPTASPAIRTVAGPVSEALAMLCAHASMLSVD